MKIALTVCDAEGRSLSSFLVGSVPRVGEEIDAFAGVPAPLGGVDPLPVDVRCVLRVVHVPRADVVFVYVGPAPLTPAQHAAEVAKLRAEEKTSKKKAAAAPAGET